MNFISVVLMSFSILLPLVAGFFISDKSLLLKKFNVFLLVGFVTEVILTVTSFIGNNVVYVNIYTLVEVFLLGRFYVELIKSDFVKNLIWVVVVIILISGFTSCFIPTIDHQTKLYESLLILFCSFIYYIDLSESKLDTPNVGYTIINSGLLVFHATTVLIFLITKSLNINEAEFYRLYLMHAFINVCVNITFFIGLIYIRREKISNKVFV